MNQYIVISELNGLIDVCQISADSISDVVFNWIQSDAIERLGLPLANRKFALEDEGFDDQPVCLQGMENIWFQSLNLTADETIYTDESGDLLDPDDVEYADRAMASINIVKLPTLSLLNRNADNFRRCTYCAAIGETMFCRQFDDAPSDDLDRQWLSGKTPWYTGLPLQAMEAQIAKMESKGLDFQNVVGLTGVARCKINNELADGYAYRIITDPHPEV